MNESEKGLAFTALPGAGPAYAPRLFAAFSIYANNCNDAAAMASLVGMVPVTEQSGKVRRVYRKTTTSKTYSLSHENKRTFYWTDRQK